MNLFLVCFLVVGNHSNHDMPRHQTVQCDVFVADKMTDKVLDEILVEAAEKYDACETLLISVKRTIEPKKRTK